MPIQLNLLAEAQAAEEARRRDPVKRAAWLAVLLVVLVLVWSSSLQLKAILINSEVSRLEGQIAAHTNEYRGILDSENRAADMLSKLAALQSLSSNRLLNGTLLNAMQQTTVDSVQLLRLRVDQTYAIVEPTKARTNEANVWVPAKPGSATERILLTLEGTDSCPNPGDQLTKYKNALAANPFLKGVLAPTNGISLKNLSAPGVSPMTGKPGVTFTLECRYPDKTR
jgi:hypothetical protein